MNETDEVNVPLLRKAVEWVEEQDKLDADDCMWSQELWRWSKGDCGTTFCVAGYVAQLVEPRYADRDYVNDVHISTRGQRALGLSDEDAAHLFCADNTAEDVRAIAEHIAGEPL